MPHDQPGETSTLGSRSWRTGAALFLIVCAVFGVTATRSGGHLDVWSANYASWHLIATGTPWIENVSIPPLDDNPERLVWVQDPAVNGHQVIARSPGVIALGLPAYWVVQPDRMTLAPAALTAAVVTALSILLIFLAIRTRLSQREAVLAASVLAFATPVWTISADGIWPHTVTGLGIAGMAWAAATRRWWLVGIFGGVALWGRLHAAIIVSVLGLVLGRRERSFAVLLKIAIPSTILLALASVWSWWMYGSWSPMASYGGGSSVAGFAQSHADLINHAGMWVAPDRGILLWTPVLALLLPALVRSWRDLPEWSSSLLLGGLLYTFTQATLITFTGGDYFYGYRLGLEFLISATPAFAFAARRAGPIATLLLGPLIAVQVLAMSIGAFAPSLYLAENQVWVDNAFLHAISRAGVLGVALVLLAAGLGHLAQRRWSAQPRTRTTPTVAVPG